MARNAAAGSRTQNRNVPRGRVEDGEVEDDVAGIDNTDGSAIGLDWNAIYRELNTIQLQWNTANTGEVFNEVFSRMNTLQQIHMIRYYNQTVNGVWEGSDSNAIISETDWEQGNRHQRR